MLIFVDYHKHNQMTMNKRLSGFLVFWAIAGLFSCEYVNDKHHQQLNQPIHLRVIWTEDPTEHSIVSWTTLSRSSRNILYYDTVSRGALPARYAFELPAARSGKITIKPMDYEEGVPEAYYHHAELRGLLPGTTYYFMIENNGVFSGEYHFITAPTETESFRLLAGGDSRLGGEKPRYAGRTPHVVRQNMKKRIAGLVEQYPDIYALVHGADYGTTADWRHLYWYFEDLQLATTSEGRILPMVVSMGNHDTALGFFENFYLGDEINGKTAFNYFYSTNFGSEIALLTLNTEISLGGMQYHWLKDELPLIRRDNRWVLVNYHKPAFPAVKDPDDYRFARVREYWVPIFDQHRPDLVIESDGHCLKRTPPILNGQTDPDGIVYIGEGGLGAPLREPDMLRWFMQGGFGAKEYHVWMIDIGTDRIHLSAIGMDGVVLDEYTISK